MGLRRCITLAWSGGIEIFSFLFHIILFQPGFRSPITHWLLSPPHLQLRALTWHYWVILLINTVWGFIASRYILNTSTVPVLNLPVWNGLLAWPVLKLWSHFTIVPRYKWVLLKQLLSVCGTFYKQSLLQSKVRKLCAHPTWFTCKFKYLAQLLLSLSNQHNLQTQVHNHQNKSLI